MAIATSAAATTNEEHEDHTLGRAGLLCRKVRWSGCFGFSMSSMHIKSTHCDEP